MKQKYFIVLLRDFCLSCFLKCGSLKSSSWSSLVNSNNSRTKDGLQEEKKQCLHFQPAEIQRSVHRVFNRCDEYLSADKPPFQVPS
jgi:hypothetical protein